MPKLLRGKPNYPSLTIDKRDEIGSFMQMDWNLLINVLKDQNVDRLGVCFVIDYYGMSFITRRRRQDLLETCYELPEGILRDDEDASAGCCRILKEFYNLELVEITRYLGEFKYLSGDKHKTQMFCFVVKVKDVFKIQIERNDHGTWLQLSEITNWPIITHFRDFLLAFWLGEGFDPNFSRFLIEQAKREDIWRFKVRVVATRKNEVLLLKRARRQKTLPLYYEFPGKEITHKQDVDSAIVASMSEQTGYPPKDIVTFLGWFDYQSESTGAKVREFLYRVSAQEAPVKLSEHAYSAWVTEVSPSKILLTPCAKYGLKILASRFWLDRPEEIEIPPTVYAKPEEISDMQRRYLDAMDLLETTGEIVDFEALKGRNLVKAAFDPETQKKLGLA